MHLNFKENYTQITIEVAWKINKCSEGASETARASGFETGNEIFFIEFYPILFSKQE